MRRFLLSSLSLALPIATVAAGLVDISFTDRTSVYSDAPFNAAITAGVSVLTEAGALEGNPDGTFRPDALLNRAEFLKIVLKSHPASTVDTEKHAGSCFPDVGRWDWFSAYVCFAKEQGIVGGYPDGSFRPGQPVMYAEALKMLGELYGVIEELPPEWNETWYVKYREGAYAAGVGLPGLEEGGMDHLLTRGQMARLAAAYYAFFIGKIDDYRAMERGVSSRISSMRRSNAASLPQSSVSSASSASFGSFPSFSSFGSSPSFSSFGSSTSSPSSPSRLFHPATSHFLIVGSRTPAIASGIFQFKTSTDIRIVTVETLRELKSIKNLHLVDGMGRTLATLSIDKTDRSRRRWRADIEPGQSLVGPGTIPLGIEATIESTLEGGFPEEFVELKNVSIVVGDTENGMNTAEVLPLEWSKPPHQTATAVLRKVENAGPRKGTMTLAPAQRIAEFRFTANPDATITIEQLTLTPKIAEGVHVDHWSIAKSTGGDSIACSRGSDGLLTCPLPSSMGSLTAGTLTLAVMGDISLTPGTKGPTLQVILDAPGSTTSLGAVQWSDGTGHYRWVEGEAPIAEGTGWGG